jgi:hypothetical protein
VTSRLARRRPVTVVVAGQAIQISAPGLKTIRRGPLSQLNWVKDDHPDYRFYEPKTVRIHVDLSKSDVCEIIERICQREQAAMLEWADGNISDKERLAPKYNAPLEV